MGSTRRKKKINCSAMLIAMAIGVALAFLAQRAGKQFQFADEAILKTNLNTMRQVISMYHEDEGHYPQTLDDLVEVGYLRDVPYDPMTRSKATWEPIFLEPSEQLMLVDVRSGSEGAALDGSLYRTW